MRNGSYSAKCELMTLGPQEDVFYMDLSVYKISQCETIVTNGTDPSRVWRGLYLARKKVARDGIVDPTNPFLNLWN